MKRENYKLLLALALLTAFALSASICAPLRGAITLTGEAKEHSFVRVTSDADGQWSVVAATSPVEFLSADAGRTCIFVGPRGTYAVLQWVEGTPSFLAVTIVPAGPVPVVPVVPVDPVVPVVPPVVPTQVAVAMLVYESQSQDQDLSQLIIGVRTNPSLSSRLKLILDKDVETADNKPLPIMVEALKRIGDNPLPRLVGFSTSGEVVVDEALPGTVPEIAALLGRWGL